MIDFKSLVQAETSRIELDAAYVLGSEDYYKGKMCLPPNGNEDAHYDYLNGYLDAEYLSNIERFESLGENID